MTLTDYIKKNRYQNKEVAEFCGVSPAAVTHWGNGECRPSIDNLLKLSKFFGISVDELLNLLEASDDGTGTR